MSAAARLLGIAPYFLVRDVVAAAEYYRDALGFTVRRYFGEPPAFCMPQRDGVVVMLSRTEDASIVRPNARARGNDSWDAYPVCLQEEYGNREFAVTDLDGYCIAFGSTARP